MAITDIPLFSAIKTKMSWLQARQSVLAENVANASTPGFQSREIADFKLPLHDQVATSGHLVPVRTNPAHLGGANIGGAGLDGGQSWGIDDTETFETSPSGNSVVLEEEMMKVAETQLDYQMATGLYTRSMGLLKTALGRRG